MIPVSREITDLKGEFEGGLSFKSDWFNLLRRGAEKMLKEISPDSLKRTVPIYGGLTQYMQVYPCPADVKVPSRLHGIDGYTHFDYVPAAQFYTHSGHYNKFTIEYMNGVRYIVVKHPTNSQIITLDRMMTAGTKTGVTLVPNTYNYLPGSNVSLQATFNDTAFTIGDTLPISANINGVLNGVGILPLYFDSASQIDYIKLRLVTSTGNYYEMNSSVASPNNALRDGQNFVIFPINTATKFGTPDPGNITKWSVDVKMLAGQSQKVVFGKLTLQQSYLFMLDYISNYVFVDGTTRAWKETPAKGDYINIDNDSIGVLHYETARIAVRNAAVDSTRSTEMSQFNTELSREYQAYYAIHPSSEQPLSYNISPEVFMSSDPFALYGDLGFGERVGNNFHAENDLSTGNVTFVDVERPTGNFDGTNTTFVLQHAPNPSSSLMLVLNGTVLQQGLDYTILGATISFTSAQSSAYQSLAFNASYRYIN